MSATVPSEDLAGRARSIRRTVVQMCRRRGQGYAGQGLALADLMSCLYFDVMPREAEDRWRDRFVLSTGHSAIALFAALTEAGVYNYEEVLGYGTDGSRIEESPLEGTPGFEITGGSLGQGLSQAVGLAFGERLHGRGARVFCLLSDGELEEGQSWEAAMAAGHYGLDNLVALIDANGIQADGATAEVMNVDPIVDKYTAFGFDALEVDPHDLAVLSEQLSVTTVGKPRALVLRTIPGKGVPSFEEHHKVHYIRVPDPVWLQALAELEAQG
jgi:transketolase